MTNLFIDKTIYTGRPPLRRAAFPKNFAPMTS